MGKAAGSKKAASSPSKQKRIDKRGLSGKLYYGDCLTIMERMEPDSVDLIYLDPPFNSQRDYNAIYRDGTGRPLPAQIEAFSDMWSMNQERERELKDLPILMMEAGLADVSVQFWQGWVQALRRSNPNLLAYLSYMGRRLLPKAWRRSCGASKSHSMNVKACSGFLEPVGMMLSPQPLYVTVLPAGGRGNAAAL